METAQAAGRRVVDMVEEDLRPSRILTREAFENAVRVNAAIGGSTNAVIHLTALAGRVGVELDLDDFDRLVREVPTLVNLMPSGTYLMEDFCYAGGLPAVMAELLGGGLLHGGPVTVTGRTVAENTDGAERFGSDVITPLDTPFQPARHRHRRAARQPVPGRRGPQAVRRVTAPAHPPRTRPRLRLTRGVPRRRRRPGPGRRREHRDRHPQRYSAPKGYPGMPEVSNVPLPAKLLKAGVTDMVRVCDGRMSGTGYGTVVLHVAPEAAVGGPSPWYGTGTPSSSTSPPAPCGWTWTTPNSSGANRSGPRPPISTPAATPGSTPSTSNRRTAAPTSGSCAADAVTRSPGLALSTGPFPS